MEDNWPFEIYVGNVSQFVIKFNVFKYITIFLFISTFSFIVSKIFYIKKTDNNLFMISSRSFMV